jgi:hypothetical protein
MRWHYSRAMPKAQLVKVGVWEDDKFRGAIIYGLGANRHIARPFGLQSTEVAELVRVALAPGRAHPTSQCVAISLKLLRRQSPGLKLVVSYADSGQGHNGTIYQATNWIFLGGSEQSYIKVLGKVEHPRSLYDRYGRNGQSIPWLREHVDPRADRVPMPPKWKYVYAFDKTLRRKLEALAQPYPRGRSDTSDTPGHHPGEGEAASTRPLQPTTPP